MSDYSPEDLEKLVRDQLIASKAFRAILADPEAASSVIRARELFRTADEDMDSGDLLSMPVSFEELADFVESPQPGSAVDRFLAEHFPEARSRLLGEAEQDQRTSDPIKRPKDFLMSLIEQTLMPFRMAILLPALVLLLTTSIASGWLAYRSQQRVAALNERLVDISEKQSRLIALLEQRQLPTANEANALGTKEEEVLDLQFVGTEGEVMYRQKYVVGSDRVFVVAPRNEDDRSFDTALKLEYQADRTLKPEFGEILSIQTVRDGRDLLLGGGVFDKHGRLRLLHLDSGQYGELDLAFPNMVTSVASHGDKVAWVVKSELGAQFYYGKLDQLSGNTPVLDDLDSVARVAFSQAGTLMAVACERGTVRLWSLADPSQPQLILDRHVVQDPTATSGHPLITYSLTFTPDGQSLIIGTGKWIPWGANQNEGKVFVIDVNTKETTRVIDAHEGPVFAVATGPVGGTVTTAGADGAIRLWDLATGDCLQSAASDVNGVHGHSGVVQCLRYSPDGKFIATGGWDNTVRVFHSETFEQVAQLTKHEFFVQAVGFTPDGGQLFSSGADDTVRFWKITLLDGA